MLNVVILPILFLTGNENNLWELICLWASIFSIDIDQCQDIEEVELKGQLICLQWIFKIFFQISLNEKNFNFQGILLSPKI